MSYRGKTPTLGRCHPQTRYRISGPKEWIGSHKIRMQLRERSWCCRDSCTWPLLREDTLYLAVHQLVSTRITRSIPRVAPSEYESDGAFSTRKNKETELQKASLRPSESTSNPIRSFGDARKKVAVYQQTGAAVIDPTLRREDVTSLLSAGVQNGRSTVEVDR